MEHIHCAGGIVVGPDRGILVVTNQIGKHTFPKGKLKPGETTEEGALREIREESGLIRVELVRKLGVLSRHGYTAERTDVPSVIKHITFYHCFTEEQELHPLEADAVSAEWVPADNLADILTWQEELEFFNKHQADLIT